MPAAVIACRRSSRLLLSRCAVCGRLDTNCTLTWEPWLVETCTVIAPSPAGSRLRIVLLSPDFCIATTAAASADGVAGTGAPPGDGAACKVAGPDATWVTPGTGEPSIVSKAGGKVVCAAAVGSGRLATETDVVTPLSAPTSFAPALELACTPPKLLAAGAGMGIAGFAVAAGGGGKTSCTAATGEDAASTASALTAPAAEAAGGAAWPGDTLPCVEPVFVSAAGAACSLFPVLGARKISLRLIAGVAADAGLAAKACPDAKIRFIKPIGLDV